MIEAMVQAGAFETMYRRAGRGGTVLLVLPGEDQALGDWLFVTLGERLRTIAPVLPRELETAPSLFDAWLSALIDGLGLEQPAVVAGVVYAHALLSLAARDPERLGRLVLLHDGDGATLEAEAALTAEVRAAHPPVRVVAVPRAEDHAGRTLTLAGILEFLRIPG